MPNQVKTGRVEFPWINYFQNLPKLQSSPT
jgi:hypothetical protein